GGEQVKIIDFGIAKIRDSVTSPHTETGRTFGTIGYMSPEQLSAEPMTPAGDVYALGVIAYEMLTGKRPFNADSTVQLFEKQRAGLRVKPSELRPEVPEKVASVVIKALAFNPANRFQRAQDFADELARALTTEVDTRVDTRGMTEKRFLAKND